MLFLPLYKLGAHGGFGPQDAYWPAELLELSKWKVPLLVKRLNPVYKLFLRQYTESIDEFICHSKIL
jgi:hypothetical protein